MVAGVCMETEGAPLYNYYTTDIIGPDGEVIDVKVNRELVYEGNKTLQTVGTVLAIGGIVTFYTNWIHSIVDAAKSAKRINADNGFVMYQFNDRCAFGMQPSLTYERPRYMQGSKPELAAGMKFKLTS